MSSEPTARFRFRPRYRALALGAVLMGVLLLVYGVYTGESLAMAVLMGTCGVTLGLLYLASPMWRLEVVVYGDRLEVQSRAVIRFSLPFAEVRELIAATESKTCFVDGGTPAHSLLVPGPGASASYDIADKERLYDLLRARIPAERTREVTSLAAWKKALAAKEGAS